MGRAQVLEQVRQRRRQLAKIARVQAFVGGMGVGLGVLDAQEERGSAAE